MNIHQLIELINPLEVSRFKPQGELTHFTQDSRQVGKGSVFIAVRGHEVDGHIFLEDAIAREASVLVVEESFYTDSDVCVIEVEDTRTLVGPLAQAFQGNPAEQLTIVGITGTNGKTTCATLVYQLLQAAGKPASLLGTVSKRILDQEFESKLTTADPVELAADMRAMVDAGSEFLVMEVSSHALDQFRVNGISFAVGGFTNISHDHLDYHDTLENYVKAKKKLFDSLTPSSTAVVNMDNEFGQAMITDCEASVVSLSFEDGSAHILSSSAQGQEVVVDGIRIHSRLVGNFNAYNVAMAALIAKSIGLTKEQITRGFEQATGAAGRMEQIRVPGEELPTVIVDYAHTPDALQNVIDTLLEARLHDQSVVVVFGAGGDRDAAKRPKMAQAAQRAQHVIVTSDNPRTEDPDAIIQDILAGFDSQDKVITITDRKEAIERAIAMATPKEIVLIAGKGHEDYQEVHGERLPFDDREIARQTLERKLKGEL
ncbi:MAG: UDP-N-acetylmuramoyl-L-alanyl-D-glutamate--2,6-diaminopimelate ligase [Bacteroidota bacterium]